MKTKDGSRAEVPIQLVCPWFGLNAPVRSLSVIVKRAQAERGRVPVLAQAGGQSSPLVTHSQTRTPPGPEPRANTPALAALPFSPSCRSLPCQRPARPLTASTDERPRASYSLLQRLPSIALYRYAPIFLVLAPAQPSPAPAPGPLPLIARHWTSHRPFALPFALGTRLRLCPCCLPPSQRAGQVQVSARQTTRPCKTNRLFDAASRLPPLCLCSSHLSPSRRLLQLLILPLSHLIPPTLSHYSSPTLIVTFFFPSFSFFLPLSLSRPEASLRGFR
ncbi:hypothetical protein M440DRAFT_117901 [Trichoderma longibrachiatum ATCC 18648]|uniref:Uncharacterized protein n=1 Tax=Trichoderma longibrachiatum ATCC 18648 TaxID=983965 RepID=A0A2T4BYU1_TRILO|nr:hypothetical protein M440DRAFT_117901 [Trichoderma longibrachiatum ATCC 18648]